jgi:hypothetical protein
MTPTPRAVSHFGLAALEARAVRTRRAMAPIAPPQTPARLRPPTELQPQRTVVRLWLPLTAIFLLLAPFALLLAPLIYFAPRPYGVRPFATVLGVGALLLSLGGTVVDIDSRDALIRIKIF